MVHFLLYNPTCAAGCGRAAQGSNSADQGTRAGLASHHAGANSLLSDDAEGGDNVDWEGWEQEQEGVEEDKEVSY